MRTDMLSSCLPTGPLEQALLEAGGQLQTRDGLRTIAHFGRPDAEERACRQGVGLAHRGTAPVFELLGATGDLAEAVAALTGQPFVPGHATHARGAWWCATTAERVLTIGDPGNADAWLAAQSEPLPDGVAAIDRSDAFDGFRLVGPGADNLLHAVGLLPPGRVAHAIGTVCLGRLGRHLLGIVREDAERFLLFVAAADAADAWRALLDAADPYGALCVGSDALARATDAVGP